MQDSPSRLRSLILAAIACLSAWSIMSCDSSGVREVDRRARTGHGTIVVEVVGFDSDEGQVLVALFLGPTGFPNQPELAYRNISSPIINGRAELVFEEIPVGPFAVSAFHDADDNLELTTNFLDIPKEGWGVSNGASHSLGPPSYESAALNLSVGQRVGVEIRVE